MELVSFVVSLLALGVSWLAYRSGRPRLSVKAGQPAIVVDAPQRPDGKPQFGIFVDVTNDGGAPAHINYLMFGGGGIYGKHIGPPVQLGPIEAHGGLRRWFFDFNDLRGQLDERIRRDLRDSQSSVELRATLEYGGKVKRSNTVKLSPPGVYTDRRPFRVRVKWFAQSWTSPTLTFPPLYKLTAEDIDNRTQVLTLHNSGRGRSKPSQLVLMVERADGLRTAVSGVAPIDVPKIRGGRSKDFVVSFVDDSDAEPTDEFSWAIKDRNGITGYFFTALRVSKVPELKAKILKVDDPPDARPRETPDS